jgi:hypothetical protein
MNRSGPAPDWIAEVMARLQIVAVDRLEVDLDADRLLGFRQELAAQKLVRCGNEVIPPDPMDCRRLGVCGRPAGRQNGGKATCLRYGCARA